MEITVKARYIQRSWYLLVPASELRRSGLELEDARFYRVEVAQ